MAFNKNKVMDAARRYVEKGQTDKAIKEYLRVVKEDPKDVRVWLKIGDLYAKKGAKAEAIDTYVKVAKFYSDQGFYLKAVAVYKQILKLDSRLIEVNLKLAELYRQLGLMSDAMRHFEMVAGHFHREGKTKEAMATVRQLVELDPENVATRIKLAELYSKESMVEEAVAEFTRACEYLRANNRQDDFVKVAERLLWHKPDNTELNRELAGLYLRRNDPRRALQKLQLCFKANPRDVETLALLAQAFQALEQKSKTVQVLKELARVLDEDGKREQAKDIHRKILALVPSDPDSSAYVGQVNRPAEKPVAGTAPAPPPPPPPPRPEPSASARLVSSQDVPPRRQHNPTGSMPLLDPQAIPSLSYGSKPAGPADFTSEFTEDSSLVEGSAEAERHSDEIAKLLTETEVYIKYGLHQKAIEHLRRVFDLDEENIDARQRLKEILLDQGREGEALGELMRLAEISVQHDRERAAGYLREVLGIDGTYQPAFDLASRHNLDLTGEAEIEILDDLEHTHLRDGNVLPVESDIDFSDIGFGDDNELILDAGPTHKQPAQYGGGLGNDSFEFELDDSAIAGAGAGVTREMGVAQINHGFELIDDDADGLGFDSQSGASQRGYAGGGYPDRTMQTPMFDPADAAAFDADPGFPARGAGYPAEPGQTVEYGAYSGQRPASNYSAFDGEPGPTAEYSSRGIDTDSFLDMGEFAVDFDVPGDQRPTQDLSGARTQENPSMGGEFDEQTRISPPGLLDGELELMNESMFDSTAPIVPVQPGDSLEDDIEEADFYIAQGLYGEARDIVNGLISKHRGHPLLLAKLHEIDAVLAGDGNTATTDVSDIEFEELDELDALDLESDGSGNRPAVLLENPVDEKDADTHYDLGLAYKEMGLYTEAIKAFAKVTDTPGRQAQSYMMIGMCYREQGSLTEAVQQFKMGLHAQGLNEREQFSLYYEIAFSYEMLGDFKEAVYFYGLIRKKDPSYRDVSQRMTAITGAPPP